MPLTRLKAAAASAVAVAALAGPTVLPAAAATHKAKPAVTKATVKKILAQAPAATPADTSDPGTGTTYVDNNGANPLEFVIQTLELSYQQQVNAPYIQSIIDQIIGTPPYSFLP